jgi:hypothetical protein
MDLLTQAENKEEAMEWIIENISEADIKVEEEIKEDK